MADRLKISDQSIVFASVVCMDTSYSDVVLNFEMLFKYFEFFKYFWMFTDNEDPWIMSSKVGEVDKVLTTIVTKGG